MCITDFHPQLTDQDQSNEAEEANHGLHGLQEIYDSLDCGILLATLREFGINDKSLTLVQQIHRFILPSKLPG